MLRNITKLILCVILSGLLAGCSIRALTGGNDGQNGHDEKSTTIFNKGPSEKEVFNEILSYLSNDSKEPNYKEARVRLEYFVAQFPDSKWRPPAQSMLLCVDRMIGLQAQWKQERQKYLSEHAKMAKELEGLKSGARQNDEKTSAEVLRLQQENEQLKKDIQQLKNLEIQLEKREKMLR